MAYYQFRSEDSTEGYGSCEVFFMDNHDCCDWAKSWMAAGKPSPDWLRPGWYWFACFPGCMPDGDPSGPFETEALAMADAEVV